MGYVLLALRIARRELRGSAGGFIFLVVGIAIGTAAIAAIGLMSAAVLDGMRDSARDSIGGDVSLRLYHRPPPQAHLQAFRKAGALDLVAELRTSATRAGRSTLVELKAIGDSYPLYGALKLAPPLATGDALASRNGIWGAVVAKSLLTALDAAIGDIVSVGDRWFELRALIADEPDRSLRAFTLGPRMIVSRPALDGSNLVAPGAQVYWYSRLRLRDGVDADDWIATFERTASHTGYRIVNAEKGVPGAERTLALISSLLTFVAAGILLIGCVGVSSGVSAWLDRKRHNIAILKSLGTPPPIVLRIYLVQVAGAAGIGAGAGLILGSVLYAAALPQLGDWLPVNQPLRATPLLAAGGFGFLAALLFSLPPLARSEVQRPQILFHSDLASCRGRPRPRRLFALAAVSLTLAALFVGATPLPIVAVLFIPAAALTVAAFLLLGRLTAIAARTAGCRSAVRGRPLLRLALANLQRPGAPTAPLILAAGICLTLIVAIEGLRRNADRHLSMTLPASAPELVILNIDPAAGQRLDAVLSSLPQVARWRRVPFLHARMTALNGRKVAELHVPADVTYVVRGDRGVSWLTAPPPDGITAGEWWPADYDGPPLASLDTWAAGRLGLDIGDTLTLSVLGAPLQARVTNLRRVDRAALDLDFPILLSPFATPPPHRQIAAVWTAPAAGPDASRDLREQISQAFPEAPVVVVSEITAFLVKSADRLGRALGGLAAATGLAAFLVLAGTVAASRRRCLREAILLKTVGATRRQTLAANAIEFAIIALVAVLAALVLGNLAAWAAVADLIDYVPVIGSVLPWLGPAMILPAAAGFALTRWALAQPTGKVLR